MTLREELDACPFCGVVMPEFADGDAIHPPSDCFLSQVYVSPNSRAAWNSRSGDLVPLPEVEELARVMCRHEGLDPDEEVGWTFGLKRRKRWESREFGGRATAIINHMKGKE